MWYLYLGYLLVQFYPLIEKLTQVDIAPSALFFSMIVFLLWSFIPVLGFVIAKHFRPDFEMNKWYLLLLGALLAFFEDSLFYFNVLHYKQHFLAAGVIFMLFFFIAYLPNHLLIKRSKNKH